MEWNERFNYWMGYEALDHEIRDRLESSKTNAQLIEDKFYRNLEFGTAGMRGEIGAGTNRMNIYTVRKAAEGLACFINEQGKEAKERGVVIAYDCRYKSPEFALETAKTLGAHGIKSYVFDALRPTPELSFAIRYFSAFAGVMITASHNPAEYNGFKLYGEDGGQITPEAAKRIIERIDMITDDFAVEVASENELVEAGILTYIGEAVDQAYLEKIKTIEINKDVDKHVKIVYSPLHGTGYKLVKEGLAALGYENVTIVPEQMIPDSAFSTVASPNPEEHAAFELAIQYGEKTGADVLMATDPDADRLGIAVRNHEGHFEVLTGNQIGALMVHYILSQKAKKGNLPNNGMIVKSIVTNEMGREMAKRFGVETIDTLTGFKYISEKIAEYEMTQEYTYLFGYEESYGYLIHDFARDKDAVQTSIMVAEMAGYYKQQGMSLYDAMQQLFAEYGYFKEALRSITLKGKEGAQQIDELLSSFRECFPGEIAGNKVTCIEDYQSGKQFDLVNNQEKEIVLPKSNVLKFYLADGSWFCLRPSGTEPKVKLYFGVKSDTQEGSELQLEKIENDVMGLVNESLNKSSVQLLN